MQPDNDSKSNSVDAVEDDDEFEEFVTENWVNLSFFLLLCSSSLVPLRARTQSLNVGSARVCSC